MGRQKNLGSLASFLWWALKLPGPSVLGSHPESARGPFGCPASPFPPASAHAREGRGGWMASRGQEPEAPLRASSSHPVPGGVSDLQVTTFMHAQFNFSSVTALRSCNCKKHDIFVITMIRVAKFQWILRNIIRIFIMHYLMSHVL